MSRVQCAKTTPLLTSIASSLSLFSNERGCNHRSSPGQLGGLKAPKLPFSAGDPGGLSGLWNSGASSFVGPSVQQPITSAIRSKESAVTLASNIQITTESFMHLIFWVY